MKKRNPARIRALAAAGLTKAEAARRLGLDRSHFGKIVAALAPEAAWATSATRQADVVAHLRACAERGMTREEAAVAVGRSYARVCDLAREHGIALRSTGTRPKRGRHLQGRQLEDYRTFRRARFSAAEALAMAEARP